MWFEPASCRGRGSVAADETRRRQQGVQTGRDHGFDWYPAVGRASEESGPRPAETTFLEGVATLRCRAASLRRCQNASVGHHHHRTDDTVASAPPTHLDCHSTPSNTVLSSHLVTYLFIINLVYMVHKCHEKR